MGSWKEVEAPHPLLFKHQYLLICTVRAFNRALILISVDIMEKTGTVPFGRQKPLLPNLFFLCHLCNPITPWWGI